MEDPGRRHYAHCSKPDTGQTQQDLMCAIKMFLFIKVKNRMVITRVLKGWKNRDILVKIYGPLMQD